MGWWGRNGKPLDDVKEKRGCWKLTEEALNYTLWRTRFGRGYGPVIRQTTKWMTEWMKSWKGGWLVGWMMVIYINIIYADGQESIVGILTRLLDGWGILFWFVARKKYFFLLECSDWLWGSIASSSSSSLMGSWDAFSGNKMASMWRWPFIAI